MQTHTQAHTQTHLFPFLAKSSITVGVREQFEYLIIHRHGFNVSKIYEYTHKSMLNAGFTLLACRSLARPIYLATRGRFKRTARTQSYQHRSICISFLPQQWLCLAVLCWWRMGGFNAEYTYNKHIKNATYHLSRSAVNCSRSLNRVVCLVWMPPHKYTPTRKCSHILNYVPYVCVVFILNEYIIKLYRAPAPKVSRVPNSRVVLSPPCVRICVGIGLTDWWRRTCLVSTIK